MPENGVDFVGISLVFFCHDGNGSNRKVLLAKRGKGCRDEIGKWDIGAGALELHSSVESNLRDEVMQEYCTEIISYQFLGFRDVHRQHNGTKTHWIGLDFRCLVDPVKVRNGEPHKLEDVQWFDLDNLPSPLHSQLPLFLEKYRGKL